MGVDAGQAFQGGVGDLTQGTQQWGTMGTLLQAGGGLLKGFGSSQQYNYAAQVATLNQQIAAANATAAQAAGAQEGSLIKTRAGATAASQKAAQAANGIDVGSGSAAQVRESTMAVGDLDAALAQYNANRQTLSDRIQAASYGAQAAADKKAGFNALVGGVFNAASSLAGGASSLGAKAAQFRTVGAGSDYNIPAAPSANLQLNTTLPSLSF